MIPLTSTRYCPVCCRMTVHRRRLVSLDDIEPDKRVSYPVLDGQAVLPLECQEHDDGRLPP